MAKENYPAELDSAAEAGDVSAIVSILLKSRNSVLLEFFKRTHKKKCTLCYSVLNLIREKKPLEVKLLNVMAKVIVPPTYRHSPFSVGEREQFFWPGCKNSTVEDPLFSLYWYNLVYLHSKSEEMRAFWYASWVESILKRKPNAYDDHFLETLRFSTGVECKFWDAYLPKILWKYPLFTVGYLGCPLHDKRREWKNVARRRQVCLMILGFVNAGLRELVNSPSKRLKKQLFYLLNSENPHEGTWDEAYALSGVQTSVLLKGTMRLLSDIINRNRWYFDDKIS